MKKNAKSLRLSKDEALSFLQKMLEDGSSPLSRSFLVVMHPLTAGLVAPFRSEEKASEAETAIVFSDAETYHVAPQFQTYIPRVRSEQKHSLVFISFFLSQSHSHQSRSTQDGQNRQSLFNVLFPTYRKEKVSAFYRAEFKSESGGSEGGGPGGWHGNASVFLSLTNLFVFSSGKGKVVIIFCSPLFFCSSNLSSSIHSLFFFTLLIIKMVLNYGSIDGVLVKKKEIHIVRGPKVSLFPPPSYSHF